MADRNTAGKGRDMSQKPIGFMIGWGIPIILLFSMNFARGIIPFNGIDSFSHPCLDGHWLPDQCTTVQTPPLLSGRACVAGICAGRRISRLRDCESGPLWTELCCVGGRHSGGLDLYP